MRSFTVSPPLFIHRTKWIVHRPKRKPLPNAKLLKIAKGRGAPQAWWDSNDNPFKP